MLRDGRTLDELGESFVAFLRTALDAPTIALDGSLTEIAGGFANPIYGARLREAPPSYDRDLVIRVAGRGKGPDNLAREFEIQRFLYDRGYPTAPPLLFDADPGPLGAAFIVMGRLEGKPLLDAIFPPNRRSLDAIDTLPRLLLDLHRVPTDGFPGDSDRATIYRDQIRQRADDSYAELAAVSAWLEAERPPLADVAVCHLDFQPFNVMVAEDGRVTGVLDWENTGLADRHLDLADCRVVLELAPFDAGRLLNVVAGPVRRWWTGRIRRIYSRRWPLDPHRLAYYEVLAAARRLMGALEDRPKEPGGEPTGFTSPEFIANLTRFIDRAIR
jgi:aminoglycoside phosphotransferase (APT) family kinase protein